MSTEARTHSQGAATGASHGGASPGRRAVPLEGQQQLARLGLRAEQLPRHVAIIMDGNGRWAEQRGRPRIIGHRAGIQSVRAIVEEGCRLGLDQLTLYCFSVENWKRPAREIAFLMKLLKHFVIAERRELMEQNVRLRMIGGRDALPPWVLAEIDRTVTTTARNTGMTLCLAVNYGGRTELVEAARRIAHDAATGRLAPEHVDEALFGSYLSTAGMLDPDLLIRTAGEMRVSNFLLWQISYAEIWVTDVLWPDFRASHLHQALGDYVRRERKFGALPTSPAVSSET